MDNGKAEGERPTIVPLRKIVEYHPVRRRMEMRMVDLECGHKGFIRKSDYPKRTRCRICFQELVNSWDAEHTCSHGVLMKTSNTLCKDCRIAELEDKVDSIHDSCMRFLITFSGPSGR